MSLLDKDRIFTNLYGYQSWRLDAAMARGDWDNTKALLELGQDTIIDSSPFRRRKISVRCAHGQASGRPTSFRSTTW